MDIFDGTEALVTLISELFIKKGFDKNQKLSKRIPYIFLYILFSVVVLIILFYVFIYFIKKNILLGIFTLLIYICVFLVIISPFFKNK